ncbi:MAG TPA: hypothetical protein VNS60_00730, partial [Solirubrobacterales bacterium]|nr:hypothetical protein [Solirubrobacterales bacterium]
MPTYLWLGRCANGFDTLVVETSPVGGEVKGGRSYGRVTHVDSEAGDVGRSLIEEMLRTALWLFDISTSLLEDLPDDAFPGEDSAQVMVEMLTGSCRPSIDAAGVDGCQVATELMVSIRENVLSDMR